MGAECPNGHGRRNVIMNITADGSKPKKALDVIAQKLECGCVVGGEEYEAFQLKVLEIRNAERLKIMAAREAGRQAMAAAFKAMKKEEVE